MLEYDAFPYPVRIRKNMDRKKLSICTKCTKERTTYFSLNQFNVLMKHYLCQDILRKLHQICKNERVQIYKVDDDNYMQA